MAQDQQVTPVNQRELLYCITYIKDRRRVADSSLLLAQKMGKFPGYEEFFTITSEVYINPLHYIYTEICYLCADYRSQVLIGDFLNLLSLKCIYCSRGGR